MKDGLEQKVHNLLKSPADVSGRSLVLVHVIWVKSTYCTVNVTVFALVALISQ